MAKEKKPVEERGPIEITLHETVATPDGKVFFPGKALVSEAVADALAQAESNPGEESAEVPSSGDEGQ